MPAVRSVETRIFEDPANPQLVVAVTADDGVRGVGECWWGTYRPSLPPGAPVRPIRSVIDELLAPQVVGRDAEDPGALAEVMEAETSQYGDGIVRAAISGIDIALWDSIARRDGIPIVELLGGQALASIPVYASLDWLGEEAAVRHDARAAVAAGFGGVKLHEHDPALVATARDEVGPGVAVMVDVGGRFDATAAVDAARAYAASGVEWLEEPVAGLRDHQALAVVRAGSPVPIGAGENEYTVDGFRRMIAAGAVDVLQPEISKFGGLTPALEVARIAAAGGVALCPHNFSMGPSFFASLQWALATPGASWLEMPWLPGHPGFPGGIAPPPIDAGAVALPEAPGLGLPEWFYRSWE